MSLAPPEKIRTLQRKLYRKAKAAPAFRFYLLYDKICRDDILEHAYALARTNRGAPGVDGVSFAAIEAAGLEAWRAGIRKDLVARTYRPQPVRRVMIPKPGHWYLGASPSKKSVLRLKAKVSDLLGDMGAWPEVRDRLNRLWRGWSAYFGYGTRLPAYRAIDNHVYDRVRHVLVRRHKVPSHGTNRFPREAVFGALGVLRLRRVHLRPPPCALR